MPENVVPYEIFVEIRQRRKRMEAELMIRPVTTPTDDGLAGHGVTNEDEAMGDRGCGTRSTLAAGGAEPQ